MILETRHLGVPTAAGLGLLGAAPAWLRDCVRLLPPRPTRLTPRSGAVD